MGSWVFGSKRRLQVHKELNHCILNTFTAIVPTPEESCGPRQTCGRRRLGIQVPRKEKAGPKLRLPKEEMIRNNTRLPGHMFFLNSGLEEQSAREAGRNTKIQKPILSSPILLVTGRNGSCTCKKKM